MKRTKGVLETILSVRLARASSALAGFAVVTVLLGSGSASALDPAAQRGATLAQTNCARCHAIGKHAPSPMSEAPPFRVLHTRYAVEDLAESLAEGIVTGHPAMPEWRFDPDQTSDLIAYLKTLE